MSKNSTQKVEAYGVKGMKSTPWHKTFKNFEALMNWVAKNDAQLNGWREVR